jgi:hypothetical protein
MCASAATLTFEMKESGGDVVGSVSGSLNTDFSETPVTASAFYTDQTEIQPGSGFLVVSNSTLDFGSQPYSTYALTGSSTWGSGATATQGQTSSLTVPYTVEAVGLDISGGSTPVLLVQVGSPPGGSYSGAFSFQNTNFASMGVTPGTYSYTRDNGDIVEVVFTPVPLPGAVIGALTGLGFLAAIGRRRRAA